jgi:hypothetical protein
MTRVSVVDVGSGGQPSSASSSDIGRSSQSTLHARLIAAHPAISDSEIVDRRKKNNGFRRRSLSDDRRSMTSVRDDEPP